MDVHVLVHPTSMLLSLYVCIYVCVYVEAAVRLLHPEQWDDRIGRISIKACPTVHTEFKA